MKKRGKRYKTIDDYFDACHWEFHFDELVPRFRLILTLSKNSKWCAAYYCEQRQYFYINSMLMEKHVKKFNVNDYTCKMRSMSIFFGKYGVKANHEFYAQVVK